MGSISWLLFLSDGLASEEKIRGLCQGGFFFPPQIVFNTNSLDKTLILIYLEQR